jgi:hypothetical protein
MTPFGHRLRSPRPGITGPGVRAQNGAGSPPHQDGDPARGRLAASRVRSATVRRQESQQRLPCDWVPDYQERLGGKLAGDIGSQNTTTTVAKKI